MKRRVVVARLKQLGYLPVRDAKHGFIYKNGDRWTMVPDHDKDVSPGVLRSIERDIEAEL